MTGSVPQFPGKGGLATPGKPGPTQPVPGWRNAICPLLTAGEVAKRQDNLVVTAGVQPAHKAQPCLGPQCMWFVSAKSKAPDGSEVETSGCAPVFQVGQQNAQAMQMGALVQMVGEFIAAARRGAEAEAAHAAAVATAADPFNETPTT